MLIKKELKKIPVQAFLKIPNKEGGSHEYAASATVHTSEKCGNVLAVDIFDTKTKSLKLRFFCDGVNYLVCQNWPAESWLEKKPEKLLGISYYGEHVFSLEKDDKLARDFLKDALKPWCWSDRLSLFRCIESFAAGKNRDKQEKAMNRKYSLMAYHFAMFPDYPADLPEYCEHHVFGHGYIFISKAEKGRKEAVCGHCGQRYPLEKARPGMTGSCPDCGQPGKYRGMWVETPPEDKAKICVAHRIDGQLLIRWAEVRRYYSNLI